MGLAASFVAQNVTMALNGQARLKVMTPEHLKKFEQDHKKLLGPEAQVE